MNALIVTFKKALHLTPRRRRPTLGRTAREAFHSLARDRERACQSQKWENNRHPDGVGWKITVNPVGTYIYLSGPNREAIKEISELFSYMNKVHNGRFYVAVE